MAVLLAVACTGCVKRAPDAVVGQRVAIYRGEELGPSPEVRPTRSEPVVGELVDRTADTVRVRARPGEATRSFVVDASTRLPARPPTSVADPWLLGDSLLQGRAREGRRHWTVAGHASDTILLLGSQTSPSADAGERGLPPLRRQVYRARPTGPLVLGTISLTGGILLARWAGSREPEPSNKLIDFDIDAGDVLLAVGVMSLIGGGAGALITAFIPRLGWDTLEPDEVPPLRPWSDGDGRALELRWRLPVGAPHPRTP